MTIKTPSPPYHASNTIKLMIRNNKPGTDHHIYVIAPLWKLPACGFSIGTRCAFTHSVSSPQRAFYAEWIFDSSAPRHDVKRRKTTLFYRKRQRVSHFGPLRGPLCFSWCTQNDHIGNVHSGTRVAFPSTFLLRYLKDLFLQDSVWNTRSKYPRNSQSGIIRWTPWQYRSSARSACGSVYSVPRWEPGSFITFRPSLCSGSASNRCRAAAPDRPVPVPGPRTSSGEPLT